MKSVSSAPLPRARVYNPIGRGALVIRNRDINFVKPAARLSCETASPRPGFRLYNVIIPRTRRCRWRLLLVLVRPSGATEVKCDYSRHTHDEACDQKPAQVNSTVRRAVGISPRACVLFPPHLLLFSLCSWYIYTDTRGSLTARGYIYIYIPYLF